MGSKQEKFKSCAFVRPESTSVPTFFRALSRRVPTSAGCSFPRQRLWGCLGVGMLQDIQALLGSSTHHVWWMNSSPKAGLQGDQSCRSLRLNLSRSQSLGTCLNFRLSNEDR